MKKVLKQMITFICIMFVLSFQHASAITLKMDNKVISETTYSMNSTVSTVWKTVLESSNGMNRNVTVSVITSDYKTYCSIRFLDKNNNIVWAKNNAIQGNGDKVTFWCGQDVYKIQIKTAKGTGSVELW